MAEYIERDKLLDDFELCNKQNPRWTPQRVKSLLVRANAADVVEVVHGRWKRNNRGNTCCSECMSETGTQYEYDFCPNCGARMDGYGHA